MNTQCYFRHNKPHIHLEGYTQYLVCLPSYNPPAGPYIVTIFLATRAKCSNSSLLRMVRSTDATPNLV